ncbi:hypothetical protein GF362_06595 [Candidatus Dojkabacteria bacterium]|nr:hypothetical protein [Candidatus Dojkabacteria bacterium]
MKENYLNQISKPIIGLAPMDGVTDAPFRYIHSKYGNPPPDIIYTEFVSTEGIIRGIERLFEKLIWHDFKIPIIAQIFGNRPQAFFEAAQIICEFGFAGVDINMGCPARNIAKKGGGASLISTPKLAKSIVEYTNQGIEYWVENGLTPNGDFLDQKVVDKVNRFIEDKKLKKNIPRKKIPVSIKTRIGIKEPITENWTQQLIKMEPSVISMHGRTLKQAYKGEADWQELAKASRLINNNSGILFFANGDVTNPDSAKKCLEVTNADGLLIGRAAYGNPWIIGNIINSLRGKKTAQRSQQSLKKVMIEHAQVYNQTKSPKSFYEMRKHLAWYIKNKPNASQLRSALVKVNNINDLEQIINKFQIS